MEVKDGVPHSDYVNFQPVEAEAISWPAGQQAALDGLSIRQVYCYC
jgi:hypothetical protein